MVELVFEEDARVEESIGEQLVAGLHLLGREGNLREIIFALMRIVALCLHCLFERIAARINFEDRVALGL